MGGLAHPMDSHAAHGPGPTAQRGNNRAGCPLGLALWLQAVGLRVTVCFLAKSVTHVSLLRVFRDAKGGPGLRPTHSSLLPCSCPNRQVIRKGCRASENCLVKKGGHSCIMENASSLPPVFLLSRHAPPPRSPCLTGQQLQGLQGCDRSGWGRTRSPWSPTQTYSCSVARRHIVGVLIATSCSATVQSLFSTPA